MKLELGSYADTMAHYNQWMNENLYSAAATLSNEKRRAACGLYFGSIYSTLNHLLVCDLMWLARFKGEAITLTSITQELFSDFEQLRAAREQVDKDIIVLGAWFGVIGPA